MSTMMLRIRFHLHIPQSAEEALWTIYIKFEDNFSHKEAEKDPLGSVIPVRRITYQTNNNGIY